MLENAVCAGAHTCSAVMLLFFISYSTELSGAAGLCMCRCSWLSSSQGTDLFSFLAWFIFFGTYHSMQTLKLPDYALNLWDRELFQSATLSLSYWGS